MDNELYLVYTCFVDFSNEGIEQGVSYGYRLFCKDVADYYNLFPTLEELMQTLNKSTIQTWLQRHHSGKDNSYNFYKVAKHNGRILFNDEIVLIT